MKTITLGDTHGSQKWKSILKPGTFESLVSTYDRIVFMGDYVDDFMMYDDKIYDNLLEIIDFKKKNMDKVILLWGNHDIHYLFDYQIYGSSGWRVSMNQDLKKLFNENKHLFQLAYQIDNTIWTHAGIHRGWYHQYIHNQKYIIEKKSINHPEEKTEIEIDKSGNLADVLNFCFDNKHHPIFHCGLWRGGINKTGGPLWADKLETYSKPLLDYHHIIGHTESKEVKHYNNYKGDTSTTYVDCIKYDEIYEKTI